jgi:hypothetical protein
MTDQIAVVAGPTGSASAVEEAVFGAFLVVGAALVLAYFRKWARL